MDMFNKLGIKICQIETMSDDIKIINNKQMNEFLHIGSVNNNLFIYIANIGTSEITEEKLNNFAIVSTNLEKNLLKLLRIIKINDSNFVFCFEYAMSFSNYLKHISFELMPRLILFKQLCEMVYYFHQNNYTLDVFHPNLFFISEDNGPKLKFFYHSDLIYNDLDLYTTEQMKKKLYWILHFLLLILKDLNHVPSTETIFIRLSESSIRDFESMFSLLTNFINNSTDSLTNFISFTLEFNKILEKNNISVISLQGRESGIYDFLSDKRTSFIKPTTNNNKMKEDKDMHFCDYYKNSNSDYENYVKTPIINNNDSSFYPASVIKTHNNFKEENKTIYPHYPENVLNDNNGNKISPTTDYCKINNIRINQIEEKKKQKIVQKKPRGPKISTIISNHSDNIANSSKPILILNEEEKLNTKTNVISKQNLIANSTGNIINKPKKRTKLEENYFFKETKPKTINIEFENKFKESLNSLNLSKRKKRIKDKNNIENDISLHFLEVYDKSKNIKAIVLKNKNKIEADRALTINDKNHQIMRTNFPEMYNNSELYFLHTMMKKQRQQRCKKLVADIDIDYPSNSYITMLDDNYGSTSTNCNQGTEIKDKYLLNISTDFKKKWRCDTNIPEKSLNQYINSMISETLVDSDNKDKFTEEDALEYLLMEDCDIDLVSSQLANLNTIIKSNPIFDIEDVISKETISDKINLMSPDIMKLYNFLIDKSSKRKLEREEESENLLKKKISYNLRSKPLD